MKLGIFTFDKSFAPVLNNCRLLLTNCSRSAFTIPKYMYVYYVYLHCPYKKPVKLTLLFVKIPTIRGGKNNGKPDTIPDNPSNRPETRKPFYFQFFFVMR